MLLEAIEKLASSANINLRDRTQLSQMEVDHTNNSTEFHLCKLVDRTQLLNRG